MESIDSVLVVRRSIFIDAKPERVWEEFTTFDRMSRWWGAMVGDPVAGEANGQRLVGYEPRQGARIEMEIGWGTARSSATGGGSMCSSHVENSPSSPTGFQTRDGLRRRG